MKAQFTILQKNLKAVAYAMAKDDIRFYLNGVLFEHNGNETRIVATDGHRLNAVLQEHDSIVIDPVSFIMPHDMVKACIKAKAARYDKSPTITISYDDGKIEARMPDQSSIVHHAIDGNFPDYKRVIPSDTSFDQSPAVFNSAYLYDAELALRDFLEIGKKSFLSVGIAHRGNSSGVLSVLGFVAVIMPMRAELTPCADLRLTKPIQSPEKIDQLAA